jgi:hypothetical protein
MFKYLFLLSFLVLCACAAEQKRENRFYYWKSQLAFDAPSLDLLNRTDVLYLRLFDLRWEASRGEIVPTPAIRGSWPTAARIKQVVPTIFITNSSLLHLSPGEVDALASRLLKKIEDVLLGLKLPNDLLIQELQLDCDWSAQTKDKYFALLKSLRKQSKYFKSLSATIRLHQIKFPDVTGVPPVDRGVLMFYNMGKVNEYDETNSILDLATAEKYLVDMKDYPLDLDLALPLFGWAAQFRGEKLLNLISPIDWATLEVSGCCRLKEGQRNRYEVVQGTYLGGVYVYEGDELRLEVVSGKLLEQTLAMVLPKMAHRPPALVWYHLDSVCLTHLPLEVFEPKPHPRFLGR